MQVFFLFSFWRLRRRDLGYSFSNTASGDSLLRNRPELKGLLHDREVHEEWVRHEG